MNEFEITAETFDDFIRPNSEISDEIEPLQLVCDDKTMNKLQLFLENEQFMSYVRDPTNNISKRVYRHIQNRRDADLIALTLNLCFLYLIFPPDKKEYDFADTLLMMWSLNLVQKIE